MSLQISASHTSYTSHFGYPQKVVSGVVIASQSDEDHTLTSTPSRTASGSKGASGSVDALGSWYDHSSRSNTATSSGSISQGENQSDEPTQQASYDEATRLDSAPAPQADVPTPVVEKPNRWCVDCEYQVNRDAKVLKRTRD